MRRRLKKCDGPCNRDSVVIWKRDKGLDYCQFCWNKINSKKTIPTNKSKSKSPSFLPKQSKKRTEESLIYSKERKEFLLAHPFCFINIPGICTKVATSIQHLKGRGKYYLDKRYWKGACIPCHSYCDTHPKEAFENGWALPRIPD